MVNERICFFSRAHILKRISIHDPSRRDIDSSIVPVPAIMSSRDTQNTDVFEQSEKSQTLTSDNSHVLRPLPRWVHAVSALTLRSWSIGRLNQLEVYSTSFPLSTNQRPLQAHCGVALFFRTVQRSQ